MKVFLTNMKNSGNDTSNFTENDTPRTDAALKEVLQTGQHPKVKAEFARQLERELNEARKALNDSLRGKSL